MKANGVRAEYEPLEMKMVTDWIPFEDGRYSVPEAFLVTSGNAAVELSQPLYRNIYRADREALAQGRQSGAEFADGRIDGRERRSEHSSERWEKVSGS
jgi:hypothetical protein